MSSAVQPAVLLQRPNTLSDERPIRACLICFAGYPDQGATYFYEMSRSLARLGVSVTAYAVQRDGEPDELTEDGVHVVRQRLPLTMRWGSPRRWLSKVKFLIGAARYVRTRSFDVVHVYTTIGAFLVPLLGDRKAKWVHELQSGAVSFRSRALRWTEDRVRGLQGAAFDENFVVTSVLGRRLFGDRARTARVVPAGVNLRVFQPGLTSDLRGKLNIAATDVVFVHAGVLEEARGTDIPLRAFARALNADRRLWLLMPGKGSQLEALRLLADRLGIAGRVWLPGYVPYAQLPRVFAAADAGVSYLPAVSYYEGQPPMKVMEYMAAGLPVIATDVSSHRLLIRSEVNGLLAPPDEVGFSLALLRFAANPELRQRLAAEAIPSVDHLTYDRIAEELVLPAYRQLIGSG